MSEATASWGSVLEPPRRLLARLREDPLRAPEHIALAASEVHAPAGARLEQRFFSVEPR
jgi:hypothetical protein